MSKKHRVAVALVVLTDEVDFWKKESLLEFFGSRVSDVEVLRIRNYGTPIDETSDNPVKIVFEDSAKEE